MKKQLLLLLLSVVTVVGNARTVTGTVTFDGKKLTSSFSAADFNSSLVELEASAREKALERGLLDKADENARRIIRNFIAGLVDTTRWSVRFETV